MDNGQLLWIEKGSKLEMVTEGELAQQQRQKHVAQVEAKVREILDGTMWTNRGNDNYSYDIPCAYNDRLDDSVIKSILSSDTPTAKFYEYVSNAWEDTVWDEHNNLIEGIKMVWDKETWDDDEDIVQEYVFLHVEISPPYDDLAKQLVCVNLAVDTGDGNYGFVLNSTYPHYDGDSEEEIDDLASIVWLAKEQGYTKEELENALKTRQFDGSKFLKSMYEEVANCASHMNALVFLSRLTLKDCLKLNERIIKVQTGYNFNPQDNPCKESIIIPKNTTCGLYDFWSGGGSLLEIELEKDVELPLKFIDSALSDGDRGYSIHNVYGVCDSLWTEMKVKYNAE